jgi:hypothetical protein
VNRWTAAALALTSQDTQHRAAGPDDIALDGD